MTVTYETIRQPRKMTAAEAAERLGVTSRTIRRYQAEKREDFLSRATDRQRTAHELQSLGMTWAQVGEKMGCSAAAARQLGHRWRTANGIEPQSNRFALVQLQDIVRSKPTETSAERFKLTLQHTAEETPISLTVTRDEYAAVLMALEYRARNLDDIDAAHLSVLIHKVFKAMNTPTQQKQSRSKRP